MWTLEKIKASSFPSNTATSDDIMRESSFVTTFVENSFPRPPFSAGLHTQFTS